MPTGKKVGTASAATEQRNAGRAGLVDGGSCTRRAVVVWCFCFWSFVCEKAKGPLKPEFFITNEKEGKVQRGVTAVTGLFCPVWG
jgi:hypothetical protein